MPVIKLYKIMANYSGIFTLFFVASIARKISNLREVTRIIRVL